MIRKERRSYPRYPVDFKVTVILPPDGNEKQSAKFGGEAVNLSRTSIQFGCDAELVQALLRQPQLPYVCRLEFLLPWHQHRFKVDAQVVTHRRISQHQYVLVLLLKHDNAEQENLLDTLLGERQAVGLD